MGLGTAQNSSQMEGNVSCGAKVCTRQGLAGFLPFQGSCNVSWQTLSGSSCCPSAWQDVGWRAEGASKACDGSEIEDKSLGTALDGSQNSSALLEVTTRQHQDRHNPSDPLSNLPAHPPQKARVPTPRILTQRVSPNQHSNTEMVLRSGSSHPESTLCFITPSEHLAGHCPTCADSHPRVG